MILYIKGKEESVHALNVSWKETAWYLWRHWLLPHLISAWVEFWKFKLDLLCPFKVSISKTHRIAVTVHANRMRQRGFWEAECRPRKYGIQKYGNVLLRLQRRLTATFLATKPRTLFRFFALIPGIGYQGSKVYSSTKYYLHREMASWKCWVEKLLWSNGAYIWQNITQF